MGTWVTNSEKKILDGMYGGDARRDASSKIRGFIFQDLLAIEYLLNDDVECICSEYLEDVDAFFIDGRLEIVQAKYYPKTTPDMNEIETDLYYQYLRLDLLNSKLKVIPLLAICRQQSVSELSIQQLKDEISPPQNIVTVNANDIEDWLTSNVYEHNKQEQKQILFSSFSQESSITGFANTFQCVKKKNLKEYQEELEQKLLTLFGSPSSFLIDDKNKKKILFGLAIEFIQRRYKLEASKFETIRIYRADFLREMRSCLQVCDDTRVSAYLNGIAAQVFFEIIEENEKLSENQKMILNTIFKFSLEWLEEIGKCVEGQLQILNTLSDRSFENVLALKNNNALTRLVAIAECYHPIKHFLKFFWKIIYDICLGKEEFNIISDEKMMNPKEYILREESRYICLSFPDKYVKTSAILYAEPGEPVASRKRLCRRMTEFKPKKWFLLGNVAGKFDYDYNTADIIQGDSVTDVGAESFKIECLQCIKVDYGEWINTENCNDCIFSRTCVERKE